MSTRTTLALGVLNVDGLHLYGRLVVPVANALRPVGDLCPDARRAAATAVRPYPGPGA